MRELDRPAIEQIHAGGPHPDVPGGSGTALADAPRLRSLALVGRGRAGRALARAFRDAELEVRGPLGRGVRLEAANGSGAPDAILLCVPDSEIRAAARAVAGAAPLIGHTSGATPLSALEPRAEGTELFGFHPLQTLTGEQDAHRLAGSGCAVAGSTPRALAAARDLADRIGLEPFVIADEGRAAYHAAASIASNFLVVLQDAAETIARDAGMPPAEARRVLRPLVRATMENWARLGPEGALTGPVARGDDHTVAVQRAAVERADSTLLPVFDALVERTRHVARRSPDSGSLQSGEVSRP